MVALTFAAWLHSFPWLLQSLTLRLRLAYLVPAWYYTQRMWRRAERRLHVLGLRESTENIVHQRKRKAAAKKRGFTVRKKAKRDWLHM